MADPKIRIVGDSKKAIQMIAALERRVDGLNEKLKRANVQSKKTGKGGMDAFKGMGRAILGADVLKHLGDHATR